MTRPPVCSLCQGRGYTIETPKTGKLFVFCECARGRSLRGWIEEFFKPKAEASAKDGQKKWF
jgi:hypothetical protein